MRGIAEPLDILNHMGIVLDPEDSDELQRFYCFAGNETRIFPFFIALVNMVERV